MIPLSKPYILKSDLGYIKKVLKSKQFTDGKFQYKGKVYNGRKL